VTEVYHNLTSEDFDLQNEQRRWRAGTSIFAAYGSGYTYTLESFFSAS